MADDKNLYSSYIAVCVFNAILSLTAITLNSLTIHAIRRTMSLPKSLKILLLSLAFSDLGVGLLVQPLAIAVFVRELQLKPDQNPTDEIMHSVFFVLLNLFYYATFFGVTALTVDRFLAIHLHLRYQEHVTHKRVITVVILIWISSVFISSFSLWILLMGTLAVIYATIELACLLFTALLYCKIYLAVRRHRREIQALQVQQPEQNNENINVARQRKSAVGTFYVYVVFLACYLPNNCLYFAMLITNPENNLKNCLFLYVWTIAWLNSCLNPLIYCWKMKQIRQVMKNILRNILPGHN